MSKIKGRKVKIVNGLFYTPDDEGQNRGVIHSVGGTANGDPLVNVSDGAGVMLPCYPEELRYLNNRKVVIDG